MSELERKIAELSALFTAKAGENRMALKQALDAGDLVALRDRAHRLAGIAGMFGQDEIGATALELELALDEQRDHETLAQSLDRLLADLEASA